MDVEHQRSFCVCHRRGPAPTLIDVGVGIGWYVQQWPVVHAFTQGAPFEVVFLLLELGLDSKREMWYREDRGVQFF